MQLSEDDELVPYTDKEAGYKTLKQEYYAETDIIETEQLKGIG